MPAPVSPSELQFSLRLVLPFLRALQGHPEVPAELLRPLVEANPDDRLPAHVLLELLRAAVELTGDECLGLHAAEAVDLGEYDVLEYAASSCGTAREAVQVIHRYAVLLNEAADFSLEVRGEKAFLWMRTRIPQPRAAVDFQMAAVFRAVGQWLGPDVPKTEVWFECPAPEDISEYRRVFRDSSIRFGAPGDGFVFDANALDMQLKSANPKLNTVLKRYADQLLAGLSRTESFTGKVRRLVTEHLPAGSLNVNFVAAHLHMSRRSLHRRLVREGTTYRQLVDEVRHRLALHYLEMPQLGIGEIAFMLGFANSAAFYRAFKRWTGRAPLEYRRARGG